MATTPIPPQVSKQNLDNLTMTFTCSTPIGKAAEGLCGLCGLQLARYIYVQHAHENIRIVCKIKYARQPRTRHGTTRLHASCFHIHRSLQAIKSLFTKIPYLLPWLQMHPPFIGRWMLASEDACSQTLNVKTCQTTASGTPMPKQTYPCKRCTEGYPSLHLVSTTAWS